MEAISANARIEREGARLEEKSDDRVHGKAVREVSNWNPGLLTPLESLTCEV